MRWLLVRLAVVAGGIAAALALGEIALRVGSVWIGRHSDTMFTVVEHDPELGWRMKRGRTTTVDFVDREGIPVRSNALGFWDREFAVHRAGGVCRIAFLGDSFTWGLGVRAEERFSDLLAARRADRESMNFGIPAYGTDQAVLTWEKIAAPFDPDVVVLTVFQNDYADNVHDVRYGRRKPYFDLAGGGLRERGVPVPERDFWDDGVFNRVAPPYARYAARPVERRSRLSHWMAKNSDVARLAYTALRRWRAAARPDAAAVAAAPPRSDELDESGEVQVRLLHALVRRLADDVAAGRAAFLVVLAGPGTSQHRRTKALLAADRIAVVDATTAALAERLPGGASSVYFPYNQHWRPAAHRAVAERIEAAIEAMGGCRTNRA